MKKKKNQNQSPSDSVNIPAAPVRISNYDFKKPKKFTREHLRGLNTVNEHIIRIFASNLSSLLRVFCEVSLLKMEECRYSEYLKSLPEKTLIGLIDVNDEETHENKCSMIMHFPSTVNFFLIDVLLGGSGNEYNLDRGYTDVEIAILERFYSKVTGYLSEAWKSLLPVKCSLSGSETNPKLAQFISLEDSAIVLSFQIKVREITDVFSFCLPSINLDEMLRNSMSRHAKSNLKIENEKDNQRKDQIEHSLEESTMEITAVLDTILLDMHDIVNLQVSDVIPLNKKIDSDILLAVEGEPKFTARIGDRKIKKAVKICGIASRSDINDYYNY